MVRWLARFFHYLDCYFIARRSLPPLHQVGMNYFRDLVYREVNADVRVAVIRVIGTECEGEEINREVLKNVINVCVEFGMGKMDPYREDFEEYYSRKASSWITEDNYSDYMSKVEESVKMEKDRVSHYLQSSSEKKLVEKVQHELVVVYATQLIEKEHFAVRGRHPHHCGLPGFEIDCSNNASTIHFRSYGELGIKSISYDARRLDLLDPKGCVHEVFLNLNLSLTPFRYYYVLKEYSYLNCSVTLSPSFSQVPCLSGSGYHVYTVEPSMAVPNFCRVVKTVPIPFEYSPYLSDNSFGLGLTWGSVGNQETGCFTMAHVKEYGGWAVDELAQLLTKLKRIGGAARPISDHLFHFPFLGFSSPPSSAPPSQFSGSYECGLSQFRPLIELDQGWEYISSMFAKLKRILEGLPEPQFSSVEYMTLYTTVYNMCTQKPPHNYSQQLYDKYRAALEDYVTTTVLPSVNEKHGELMLQELVKRWTNYKIMIRWLSNCFNFLDRFFIPRRSLPSLNDVGITCFRDSVYRKVQVNARVTVIGLIDSERVGEQIDRALVKNVIDLFVGIGMGRMDAYEEDFEAHMLRHAGEYYSRKAASWLLEDFCPDFLVKAEECLRRERDRVSHYLHSSSESKLVEKVQHELFEPLAEILKQKVSFEVKSLVQQAEYTASNETSDRSSGMLEQVLVTNIIELHDKHMAYFNDCSIKNHVFHKALREAFDVFCNKAVSGYSSAQLLATFCENILKKGGSQKLSDEAIEVMLDKVVKFLTYISDKDLFAEFYRKKLARRLLFDPSADKEHEKSILTKMKQQCGGQFTSKMEGMVTDLTLARENQTSFEEYLCNSPNVDPGIDFTITVLTTGFWPSYKTCDLSLPAEMVKCVEVFKGFYERKTKCRKITWIYSLGTCNIIGKFELKEIELVVSTYQGALLLLFNSMDRLSYSEILSKLNLTHEAAIRVLHSLSCAKYKILIKEPDTKTISPNDSFEFNYKFTDRMRRIKIPLPPVEERKEVIQDVEKERRYAIDAAIVRIMKSRKVLEHQQLVTECVEQLRHKFKPDIRAIKKQIEGLIIRDYLERDKEDLRDLKFESC
ncbi:hypothetical protein DVH24_035879 [Malus domestica]|uniref:Cullin family profile domain-containing protein n=1 Tax=Malus domestica TaxID=3750 RepID=A0A498JVH9_MALDO|nr:hypothetical protein DVH24_035879 [Malus domestica]